VDLIALLAARITVKAVKVFGRTPLEQEFDSLREWIADQIREVLNELRPLDVKPVETMTIMELDAEAARRLKDFSSPYSFGDIFEPLNASFLPRLKRWCEERTMGSFSYCLRYDLPGALWKDGPWFVVVREGGKFRQGKTIKEATLRALIAYLRGEE
jgi:hypothetical protein